MQEYTREELGAELAALRTVFDEVRVVDPRLQMCLDETTLEPAGPADPVPRLNAAGRAWKPIMADDGGFVFYQAVVAQGRPCVLAMGYDLPGALPDNEREANALLRILNQYREELRRDYVTGVYNRAFLDGAYRTRVAEAARSGKPVSVVAARVNEYSAVLRDEGNAAADRCLNAAAGILQLAAGMDKIENSVVRLEDGVFLIVAVGTPAAAMEAEVRRALEDARRCFSLSLSRRGVFTVQLGSADWAETGNWELMLALAEQRLANG